VAVNFLTRAKQLLAGVILLLTGIQQVTAQSLSTDTLKAVVKELEAGTLQHRKLTTKTDTLQAAALSLATDTLKAVAKELEAGTLQHRILTTEVDSIQAIDWNLQAESDSLTDQALKALPAMVDTTLTNKEVAADWNSWRPDPKKALWLALVIPGGGQIYNRKYWKLPIVYGGFIGCMYAMSWNDMMYKDYAQAYLDLMDSDPGTQSYNQFLHLGAKITKSNEDRYKDIFKKRKDRYRRWRDLSFFVMVGVYALSVIDAYVDAELSVFDISDDLSLRVEPTIMNNHGSSNPINASSLGLQCSLNF